MSQTLTKTRMAEKLRRDFGFSVDHASDIIDRMTDYIYETLKEDGGVVYLHNLGRIKASAHPPKPVHNPRTGEKGTMPAHLQWHFKPGALLKEVRFNV